MLLLSELPQTEVTLTKVLLPQTEVTLTKVLLPLTEVTLTKEENLS
jgi:hypothetical protein